MMILENSMSTLIKQLAIVRCGDKLLTTDKTDIP